MSSTGTNPLFTSEVVNAFIHGTKRTLQVMSNVEIETGKPFVSREKRDTPAVVGLIGVVVDGKKGKITLNFEKDTIIYVVEKMLDEQHQDIDPDVIDAVGEMTNQVYGTAKTTLNRKGHHFDMAIPTVIHGNFDIVGGKKLASLVIPFTIQNDNEFYVELSVEAA